MNEGMQNPPDLLWQEETHESKKKKNFSHSIVLYKAKSTKQSDGNTLWSILHSFAVTLKTPLT